VIDLVVELDRTFKSARNIDRFERYDHMISGWCVPKDRYAKHCTAPPVVLFVCRDQANAKEFCRAADPVVTAGHAYGGEYAKRKSKPCVAGITCPRLLDGDSPTGRESGSDAS